MDITYGLLKDFIHTLRVRVKLYCLGDFVVWLVVLIFGLACFFILFFVVVCFCSVFEIHSLCVALAGLKLIVYTRQA